MLGMRGGGLFRYVAYLTSCYDFFSGGLEIFSQRGKCFIEGALSFFGCRAVQVF